MIYVGIFLANMSFRLGLLVFKLKKKIGYGLREVKSSVYVGPYIILERCTCCAFILFMILQLPPFLSQVDSDFIRKA